MILRSGIFIGTALLAYALLRGWPDALPGVMRACLAVLALVAGLGLWAKRPRGNDIAARERRTPTWLDYAAIASAVLALESGFLWLLGTAPEPLESVALVIEQKLRPDAAALRAMRGGDAGSRSGNWLWTADAQRPLPRRTNFKPGLKPEIFIRLRDTADAEELLKSRVYVRSFTLGSYEDAAWSPRPVKALRIKADGTGFVKLAVSRGGRAIAHEVFHAEDPSGQNVLAALQGVTAARISPLTQVNDGFYRLPPPTTVGGYEYLATSEPMRLEDLPDGALIRAAAGVHDDLLEIPEGGVLGERLRVLARRAAGEGSTKQQLLQLQNSIKTGFEYSLVTSNVRNLDPMENFLFEEKRGHCEFFATAGSLMARALGIPSRVAYGWAGGTWYESSGLFVFRANEAHAWTELWLDGYGWVAMDPTPQSGGDDRARVAPAGEKPTDSLADGDEAADADSAGFGQGLPLLALVLMAVFAVPAGLIGVWRRNRFGGRGGDDSADSAPAGGEVPDYYRCWRRACAVRGMRMPAGFTLRRQISAVPELPDFADALLSYHYGTRYEGRALDLKTEKQLTRKIRRWEAMAGRVATGREFSE
jgi:hypothetical protein